MSCLTQLLSLQSRGAAIALTQLVTAAALLAPAAAARASSDACATATVITGTGTFPFTLIGATTGPEGQNQGSPGCIGPGPDMPEDVWFRWIAECDGLVDISTCGQTVVDTKLAFYPIPAGGCSALTTALCCIDNNCGLQSSINCEVQCGAEYFIQVAHKPGTPLGSGTFTIQCATGPCCPGNDSCPPGSLVEPEPCGLDLNGGCTSPAPAFTALDCGDTVCGTFWWEAPIRDTDWYQFTLQQPSVVSWTVFADVAVDAFIVSDCIGQAILAVDAGHCPAIATTDCLPPGIYYAFVAPKFSAPSLPCTAGGAPAATSKYVATLACVPCPIGCGEPAAGSCFSVHPTPFCDDQLCCKLVCICDPTCCTVAWDQNCVACAIKNPECTGTGAPPCPNGAEPQVYVCRAGCPDLFDPANGPEPTSGADLPSCTDFDVIAVDQCLRHDFVGCWPSCPAGCGPAACGTIVAATLEFRVTFAPAGFGNDSGDGVELLHQGGFLAGWDFQQLATLGMLGAGGVVSLDLANLPPNGGNPTNVLGSLCDGELGILIGDDVGVDYATLTVVHCRCDEPQFVLRSQGQIDGFVGPEPASPSAEVLAFLAAESLPVTPTYDITLANTVFAETLDGLPSCIVGAELRIGLRRPYIPPFSDPGFMCLEIPDSCAIDGTLGRWSMPVLDLQALGYIVPPLSATSTSVLTLPLDALPQDSNGVRDMLGDLADGRLNLFLGTSFSVDWVELDIDACCQCDGDLTGDGDVGGGDLGALLAGWGAGGPSDLNQDGTTDGSDLGVLLGSWGSCGG